MIDILTYLNRITSEHKTKPRFMALVKARLEPFIDLYECLETFDQAFDIDTAVGNQLDIIGEYVGAKRLLNFQPKSVPALLDDTHYLILLKSRIALNNWDGTTAGIYAIWNQVFPDTQIGISDNQNMTVDVIFEVASNEDPLFAVELGVHGYAIPKPMGVQLDFLAAAKKTLFIHAEFSRTAFIITHTKTGTKPRWATILTIEGIDLDELLSPSAFTIRHEQTSENLHSGTKPYRIILLGLDGIIFDENLGRQSFMQTHDRAGQKPHEAVIIAIENVLISEKGETYKFIVEPPQTSEELHAGTHPSKIMILDETTASIYETLGKEAYDIEFVRSGTEPSDATITGIVSASVQQLLDKEVYDIEFVRSGTEPQPSVLGQTDAAGITTGITPASFSVKYRKCGTGVTKS